MEKINIAELLRDCPKGMELDCLNYAGVVTFEEIFNCPDYPIKISVKYDNEYSTHTLTKYGQTCISPYNKCIIFPKGKTTWEGFQRPFVEGDIVFYNNTIAIFNEWGGETLFRAYVIKYLYKDCDKIMRDVPLFGKDVRKEIRFASKEEKTKLFDAIKANGYKWNAETNTLENLVEPRFEVGDVIQNKETKKRRTVTKIHQCCYECDNRYILTFENHDNWELAPEKFNISTLKPFDKVLVRTENFTPCWTIDFYDGYRPNIGGSFTPFGVSGGKYFQQCIPYEWNEHLAGTTKDCDEFFKNWKHRQ